MPPRWLKEFSDGDTEARAALLLSWLDKSSSLTRKRLQEIEKQTELEYAFEDCIFLTYIRCKRTISREEALMLPFFQPLALETNTTTGKRKRSAMAMMSLSGDVSKTPRESLQFYYGYDVKFKPWSTFSDDIQHTFNGQVRAKAAYKMISLSRDLKVDESYGEGEIPQLTFLKFILDNFFEAFGYRFFVHSPPTRDFSFLKNESETKKVVSLVGEGKQWSMLPVEPLPTNTAHRLCSFGFATKVATTEPEEGSTNDDLIKILGLHLPSNFEFTTSSETRASALTESLLKGNGIKQTAKIVKKLFKARDMKADNASRLWTAVMQACHRSLAIRVTETMADKDVMLTDWRKVSIVLSAKMVWFIRLCRDKNGHCFVEITDGVRVGSRGFFKTLMEVLNYVDQDGENTYLEREDWDAWDDALCRPRAETVGEEDDGDKVDVAYQGKDYYGVIPYFSQIRGPSAVIGYGRCGSVMKVRWGNTYTAVKEFVLGSEDENRYFYDVYKYELKVLKKLEILWGKHVPALLFHKPWPTRPLIGMQLGEPIEEDCIGNWPQDEQELAKETIAKVKELGWQQDDVRGRNFVRLLEEGEKRILMVDFESVVPVRFHRA